MLRGGDLTACQQDVLRGGSDSLSTRCVKGGGDLTACQQDVLRGGGI